MSEIRLATAASVRGFHVLLNALTPSSAGYALDRPSLEDEFGRLRVWSGNLGALQKGHSSLDYRLRDSPLLSSNALKLLQELEQNLAEATSIISGARLPYEQQTKPDEDDDEDDDFFSEDEDEDSDEGRPKTELEMRLGEIQDIINNLYKLSVRIRQPTIKSRSLKAASYQPKDPDTGVDLLEQYAVFDLQHTQELVRHLRSEHDPNVQTDGGKAQHDDPIVSRLARAVTLRRRQFKYWSRHRAKLGTSAVLEELHVLPKVERPSDLQRNDTQEAHPELHGTRFLDVAPSQKTGRTLLSGTEATHHHQSLDDIVDSKSVTSYATTVRDLTGKGIDLPPPPKTADGEKDFECPYCFIICPARYGKGRSWRTHVLQDLQPYVCTYEECGSPDQLFRSRKEWVQHEAGHRKAWRCPEHPHAVYKSRNGLRDHLQQSHGDSIPSSQLDSIVNVGETSTIDVRPTCPICFARADTDDMNLQNHLANHLERIAAFALPTDFTDDADGASSHASRGRSGSSRSSHLSIDWSMTEDSEDGEIDLSEVGRSTETTAVEGSSAPGDTKAVRSGLSELLLRDLPDATPDRLNILFSTHQPENLESRESRQNSTDGSPETEADELEFASTASATTSQDNSDSAPEPLTVHQIPTLRALYRSGSLKQRDQIHAPNDSYNQLISFCFASILSLKVDAIVNSSNRAMKITHYSTTLNNSVHQAAGPELRETTRKLKKLNEGQAVVTKGYRLPSAHIIHVCRPQSGGNETAGYEILAQGYQNALETAKGHHFRTIAFPLLGAGGLGFPPRVATRIALREVRSFLDTQQENVFDRIVFVAYNNIEEKALTDFVPVFFPPTHGDLEKAMPSEASVGGGVRRRLSKQVVQAFNQTDAVSQELLKIMKQFDFESGRDAWKYLSEIALVLGSLNEALLEAGDIDPHLNDWTTANVEHICNVLGAVCNSLTEVLELITAKKQLKENEQREEDEARIIGSLNKEKAPSDYQNIWDDHNAYMKSTQGLDLPLLLELCHDFLRCLDDMIVRGGDEPYEMGTMSIRLGSWLAKHTGRSNQHLQNHFDEVLYARQFQQSGNRSIRTDTVKLHQLPSLARLYQVGELKQTPTNAIPSSRMNHTVGLVREDITRLGVDVIVNSTNPTFCGSGTLDRTVQSKGGSELMEELSSFGICDEGTIKITKGYLLPAKYIFHVVPPEVYRSSTKAALRRLYRDILHQAVSLKVSSIAIPAIGTGMLGYPSRDSAMLAMEEVKGFLESMEFTTIEKIIFTVFTSNDEHVYRSLLPYYFPPLEKNLNKALPLSDTSKSQASSADEPSRPPRRSIFRTIGDAVWGVRFGREPAATPVRSLETSEKLSLAGFETHARDCDVCLQIEKVHFRVEDLCDEGNALAQNVLQQLFMGPDQHVYSTGISAGKSAPVQAPLEFPLSWKLLSVAKDNRSEEQTFISSNRPWSGLAEPRQSGHQTPPGVTIYTAEVTVPAKPEKAAASVHVWSDESQFWQSLQPQEASLHIYPGQLLVYRDDQGAESQDPLLALELTPLVQIKRHGSLDVTISRTRTLEGAANQSSNRIMLISRSPSERQMLLTRLLHAAKNNPTYAERQSVEDSSGNPIAELEADFPSVPIQDPTKAEPASASTLVTGAEEAPRHQIRDKANEVTDKVDARDRTSTFAVPSAHLEPTAGFSDTCDTQGPTPLGRQILQRLNTLNAGLHERDLANALNTGVDEIANAAEDLKARGLAHTVFGNDKTWVATKLPHENPIPDRESSFGRYRDAAQTEVEESNTSEAELSPQLGPSEDADTLASGIDDLKIGRSQHHEESTQIAAAEKDSPGS